MFKKFLTSMFAVGALVLAGCASNGDSGAAAGDSAAASGNGGADVFGKALYLRGEMNDWAAKPESMLVKVEDGVYMAKGELKVDYAPYKFKFADSAWTPGTNFGYVEAPGVFTIGGDPVVLTPNSKFEEIKVTPDADGMFEFYLDVRGEKPVTYVKPAAK